MLLPAPMFSPAGSDSIFGKKTQVCLTKGYFHYLLFWDNKQFAQVSNEVWSYNSSSVALTLYSFSFDIYASDIVYYLDKVTLTFRANIRGKARQDWGNTPPWKDLCAHQDMKQELCASHRKLVFPRPHHLTIAFALLCLVLFHPPFSSSFFYKLNQSGACPHPAALQHFQASFSQLTKLIPVLLSLKN